MSGLEIWQKQIIANLRDQVSEEQKNEEVRIKEEERRFEQDGIQQKDSQELEQNNSKIQRKIETFLILEMEICKHNLKDLFQEMAKNEAYNLIDLYRGEGQLKKKINQNTKLYKIIEICLKPNYRERKSSSELLYNLIKNHELKFDIYSTIIESLLEKQVKEMIQFYNKDHQTEGRLPLSENDFIKVFQELFKKKKYQQNMTILGFGSFGIVLSTKSANDSENEVVIKIQKIQDQQIIENEIALMTKAQSQYIIKFYSSYYIEGIETEIQKDSQNFIQKEKYAVFELERCTCDFGLAIQLKQEEQIIEQEEVQLFDSKYILLNFILFNRQWVALFINRLNHIIKMRMIKEYIQNNLILLLLDQYLHYWIIILTFILLLLSIIPCYM
ncbi:hypothetical protein ABPG72_020886 [Tetrahymena utriculariae]